MIIGTNLANVFAFVYQMIFGRIFEPEAYGALVATLSLIGVVASAVIFFSMVIVKFVSSADDDEQKKLLPWFFSRGLVVGAILCIVTLILTGPISAFIHVDKPVILLIGPILLITLISLVFKAFLQGILKFKENVIVNNIELGCRLLFALFFVYLGFEVFGAILGVLVSGFVSIALGRYFLKSYTLRAAGVEHLDTRKVLTYSAPIFVASVAINALMSTDVILAKHFFSDLDAGNYASIVTIGRIIFYGTSPISAVMFPMVSRSHAKGEKYVKIFLLSLLMTILAGGGALLLFLIIPHLVVESLYGASKYAQAADNIFWYGLFMLIFSLANVVLNYYLSIGRTKFVIPAVVAALLQIAGIWFFHNSIFEVIEVCIVVSLLLFVWLFVYFMYETRKIRS